MPTLTETQAWTPFTMESFIVPRGAGKTTVTVNKAVEFALDHPGSAIVVMAPNYAELDHAVLPVLRKEAEARGLKNEEDFSFRKIDWALRFTNGSVIWMVSAESDYARLWAMRCNLAIIDNAENVRFGAILAVWRRLWNTEEGGGIYFTATA